MHGLKPLLLATLAAALWLTAADAQSAPRKNVLFLMADDLNNALGCYGHPLVKSPNLDRLAARGVRFDRAYCQFPLCGPSRNSMLTGLHPNSTGIQNNGLIFRETIPAAISLPQRFRQEGYLGVRVGKLYHYNVPNSEGTYGHDDPASWEIGLNPAGVDRMEEQEEGKIFSLIPGSYGGTLSWYASPQPAEKHTDGLNAEDAIWVLERCAKQKDRPFFLACGFFRPHTPYVSPETYFASYPEAQMPVVQGVAEDQKDIPAPGLGSAKKEQEENLTDDLRRKAVQAYFASITFMDEQAGKVLDALDRLGLAENTIVVFTSDHGYHLGEHGLWQKMSVFEESARVPLLIAAPGVGQAGGVAKTPVGLIDLYPTLTELCGVKASEGLQGQSLAPILRDPNAKGRGWALTQVTRGGGPQSKKGERFFGYSLRTDRWRYTEWGQAAKEGAELYDHDADPKELTNLATNPDHAATVTELSVQLKAAVATTMPKDGQIPAVKEGNWPPSLLPLK